MKFPNSIKRAGYGLILLLVTLMACGGAQKGKEDKVNDDRIKVVYTTPIEGYRVHALWEMTEDAFSYLKGEATVVFEHMEHGTRFEVESNLFYLSKEELPFEFSDVGELLEMNSDVVELPYPDQEELEDDYFFGPAVVPFFFKDLNFDGNKELLLRMEGERGVMFRAYELEKGTLKRRSNMPDGEPYNELNPFTELDEERRQLKTVFYDTDGDLEIMKVYQLNEAGAQQDYHLWDVIEGKKELVRKEVWGD